jgi:tetratricopeptide (TPR) repeat protein
MDETKPAADAVSDRGPAGSDDEGGLSATDVRSAGARSTPQPQAGPQSQQEPAPVDNGLLDTVSRAGPARASGQRESSTVGRFFLMNRLGAGGQAVVYAAYDPKLDRKIALKFLHAETGSDSSAGRAGIRLMREAQALARLQHPNVIAIHDVGTEGSDVYIAEEFVNGANLADWLLAKGPKVGPEEAGQPVSTARTRAEIMDVFIQAGRGLSAAHKAGIIHRDFKPANVLIGDDGRARVVDFGLARSGAEQFLDEPEGDLEVTAKPGSVGPGGVLGTPLTMEGTVVGTPVYMAPEQHIGEPCDARTDQFGFCVSLYEALYGERPFAGETRRELHRAVVGGKVREAPKGSKVPLWIRSVLLKGLSTRQEDRYPSMDALLAELAKDPSAGRRRALLGAVGALVVIALVASGYAVLHHRGQLCKGAERKLVGVWDGPRKEAVKAAFLATGLPYSGHVWGTVEKALDAYSAGWVSMHTEACEATRLRGEQSEDVLDLRMMCLSQRLQEVKATTDLFVGADKQLVQRAVEVASGLSQLAGCADVEALKAPLRPPKDAQARKKVEEIRERIAKVKALGEAGRYAQGAKLAEVALADARATGYRPVEAEALARLGRLQARLGQNQEAEKTLEDAFWAAEACRHDEVAARAAAVLVDHVGSDMARSEDGHRWVRSARCVLERMGGDEENESLLANNLGKLLQDEGKFDEALAQHRRALAIREKLLGPEHPYVAKSLNNIANALYGQGKYDEALAQHRRALAIREKALGLDHPDVATSLNNIASALSSQGKYDEALANLRRALAIDEKALGLEHTDVATDLANIADTLSSQGKYEEALATARRALAIRERALGPKHPDVADSIATLGDVMRRQGKYGEALAHFERVRSIREKALGAEHPGTALASGEIGEAQLGLGHFTEAIAHLQRALTIIEAKAPMPEDLGELRFALARALWGAGKDRPRAVDLARKARESYAKVPARQKEIAEIDAWLAGHRVE